MIRSLELGAILSCLLLGSAGLARAQNVEPSPALLEPPAASQGYYLSLGLHGGTLTVEDDGHRLAPLGGYVGALHIGQEVMRWMDLGIVLEVGSVLSQERKGFMTSLGVEWTLRPLDATFVRLGGGVGLNHLSAAKSSDNTADVLGSVAAVTLGYAWFPLRGPRDSGGFSVSPVIRLMAVQPFGEDAAYWTTAGFEVSFWTGLPQRQLDLPLKEAFPAAPTPKSQ